MYIANTAPRTGQRCSRHARGGFGTTITNFNTAGSVSGLSDGTRITLVGVVSLGSGSFV